MVNGDWTPLGFTIRNCHPLASLTLAGGSRARRGRRRRRLARIEPGWVGPAVLVVVGHAVLGQPDHAIERARGARIPHRLDADVLVVAGVVALVELVAGAELGADRGPQ